MSLLDKASQQIMVFLEEPWTDEDGNVLTRPSTTGVPATAELQVSAASGTSARRAEQDNEGFESETNYRLRLPRSSTLVLGQQSRIEWPVGSGNYWAIVGEPHHFMGGSKTAHTDYIIRRS